MPCPDFSAHAAKERARLGALGELLMRRNRQAVPGVYRTNCHSKLHLLLGWELGCDPLPGFIAHPRLADEGDLFGECDCGALAGRKKRWCFPPSRDHVELALRNPRFSALFRVHIEAEGAVV